MSNLHPALSALAVLSTALCAASTVDASPIGPIRQTRTVDQASDVRAEPPSLEQAIDAWVSARAWIDAMEVPVATVAPPATTAPGATAIVIRMNGRVIGTAVEHGRSPDQLRRAVSRAIEMAASDDAVHLIPREDRGELGLRLTLELEIAATATPTPSRSIGQIIARFEPGLGALALRRGDRWTWSMPSILQASNLAGDPVRICVAMLQELAIDPTDLPTQELPESMTFYSAPTRRLVQRTREESPFEVLRGHEVIPLNAVARPGRVEFAQAVARHLDAHIVRPSKEAPPETQTLKPLGMRGDYRPHLDLNRTLSAPPQEQALTAFALAVYSGSEMAPSDAQERAAAGAVELLVALAEVAEVEDDPMESPTGIAFALLALAELERGRHDVSKVSTTFVGSMRHSIMERLAEPAELDHARALDLAAAASLQANGTPVVEMAVLAQRLDEAWQTPSLASFIGTMPWLLMAERSRGSFSEEVRAARVLNMSEPFRKALVASQLGVGGPEESAPDAAGGFALASTTGTTANSQSARPAMALAILLAEPSLTPDESVQDAMRSQLMVLRFLRQLTVDDRSIYAFRDRGRSIGGVRESLWDSTQPVAASAMTLLALVESERALQAAAGRTRTQSGNPGNRPEGSAGVSP